MADDLLTLAARVRAAAIEQIECAMHPDVSWDEAEKYSEASLRLFEIAKHLDARAPRKDTKR